MINNGILRQVKLPTLHRNMAWGALVIGALIAFETFNYSITEFAMRDLLGDLRFGGIAWSTILALAFCSIDFAGIGYMFSNGPKAAKQGLEIWYLFAAWLLAATMNAMLTWWGVSIAIINHGTLGNGIVSRATLLQVVPAFVAVMVWLIRDLIIGTLITSSGKLFTNKANERNSVPAMKRRRTSGPDSRVSNNGKLSPLELRPARATQSKRRAAKLTPIDLPISRQNGHTVSVNGNGKHERAVAR
jgi:hypothetical protein